MASILSVNLANIPDHTKSAYFPAGFPPTRTHLWDHSNSDTDPPIQVSMHIAYHRPLRIVTEKKTLRLALHYCREQGEENYDCILVAAPMIDSDGEGLTLHVDQFDPGRRVPGNKGVLPTTTTSDDVYIPTIVAQSNLTVIPSALQQHHIVTQCLESNCRSSSKLELSKFLLVTARLTQESASDSTLTFDTNLVTMATTFRATPIKPIPIMPTALSNNLSNPMSFSEVQEEPKTGYLTMDKTRKLILVLETDPKVASLPLIGIWVSGVYEVQHVYIWMACLRYLNSSAIQDRVCKPPDPFLVVLYPPTGGKPHFYDCMTADCSNNLELCSYSARALIGLGKGFETTDSERITLEFVQERTADWTHPASSLSSKPGDGNRPARVEGEYDWLEMTHRNDDLSPRPSPSPHPHLGKVSLLRPSVPEVSLIFDDEDVENRELPSAGRTGVSVTDSMTGNESRRVLTPLNRIHGENGTADNGVRALEKSSTKVRFRNAALASLTKTSATPVTTAAALQRQLFDPANPDPSSPSEVAASSSQTVSPSTGTHPHRQISTGFPQPDGIRTEPAGGAKTSVPHTQRVRQRSVGSSTQRRTPNSNSDKRASLAAGGTGRQVSAPKPARHPLAASGAGKRTGGACTDVPGRRASATRPKSILKRKPSPQHPAITRAASAEAVVTATEAADDPGRGAPDAARPMDFAESETYVDGDVNGSWTRRRRSTTDFVAMQSTPATAASPGRALAEPCARGQMPSVDATPVVSSRPIHAGMVGAMRGVADTPALSPDVADARGNRYVDPPPEGVYALLREQGNQLRLLQEQIRMLLQAQEAPPAAATAAASSDNGETTSTCEVGDSSAVAAATGRDTVSTAVNTSGAWLPAATCDRGTSPLPLDCLQVAPVDEAVQCGEITSCQSPLDDADPAPDIRRRVVGADPVRGVSGNAGTGATPSGDRSKNDDKAGRPSPPLPHVTSDPRDIVGLRPSLAVASLDSQWSRDYGMTNHHGRAAAAARVVTERTSHVTSAGPQACEDTRDEKEEEGEGAMRGCASRGAAAMQPIRADDGQDGDESVSLSGVNVATFCDRQESVRSSIRVDMQSFEGSPSRLTDADESFQSPVLGESVSMCETHRRRAARLRGQQRDDSSSCYDSDDEDEDEDDVFDGNPKAFYENVLGKIQNFLTQSPEQPSQQCMPLATDEAFNQHPRRRRVATIPASQHHQGEARVNNSDCYDEGLTTGDGSFILTPRLQYISMLPSDISNFDASLQVNTLAIKYLS
ncbi:PREDICTED: SCL-interrupting locus protein-like, partial [Priapulus caudatus]|uniref:SCL-interrupting locus protein-like n=1 Tax=Priapulus caudatus TaxID=37621 RepID=A0ABM1ESP2_PRICU